MNRPISLILCLLTALLVSLPVAAQVTRWQDIYKAKKKDTLFGIAQKHGITLEQLLQANPGMRGEGYQLKKGDTVFIPFAAPQTAVQPAAAPKAKTPARTDVRQREVRVGVMLPLHDVDGDGRRMVEYYRGMLLAIEDMKAKGLSVALQTWNVAIDTNLRQMLAADGEAAGARDCDIIFGPLYTAQVDELAAYCRSHGIRLVIPFSISTDIVSRSPVTALLWQSADRQTQSSMAAFMERFGQYHPVFIDCNDTTSRKGTFTFPLRKQLEARGTAYNITNLRSSEEQFAKAFSRERPNIVVLNSGRSDRLATALAKLHGLMASQPSVRVALYGYQEWLMFTHRFLSDFHQMDTYIPTTAYYNPLSPEVRRREARYRQWFGQEMQNILPRFALTGYDHATFFLEGLHRWGKDFAGDRQQQPARPLQTPLRLERKQGGGWQNTAYQLVHYKGDKSIETITY